MLATKRRLEWRDIRGKGSQTIDMHHWSNFLLKTENQLGLVLYFLRLIHDGAIIAKSKELDL